MKLFRVHKNYRTAVIVEMVFADTEDEVYELLSWERTDKPPLEIEEVKIKKGCVLSLSRPASGSLVIPPGTKGVFWS